MANPEFNIEIILSILIIILVLSILFLGIIYIIRNIMKYLQKHSENRLFHLSEYLPEEEIQTLKQVSFLIIITLCFVDIIYSLIFWSGTEFLRYFIYYDVLASLIAGLALKKETIVEKLIILFLIPISSTLHVLTILNLFPDDSIIFIFLFVHLIGFAYVIKVYYTKFIHYTESNGLGISILLLFGLIFISFIFTSMTEGKDLLDSLVMVSNAFTSNGYAVLGDTPIGKLNSLVLVWGGYILSGVGTATLAAAIISRHFNKKFEEMNEKFNQLQESINSINDEEKNEIVQSKTDESNEKP